MNAPPLLDFKKLEPTPLLLDADFSDFDCDDSDLNDFVKNDALKYQNQKIAQTTCLIYEGEIVSFYTLVCDSLRLTKKEKSKLFPWGKRGYDDYPALKIARMASKKKYQHMGLGSFMLRVILGMACDLNQKGIACRFITVDAYSKVKDFYLKNGFVPNLSDEQKNEKRISMRLNILGEIKDIIVETQPIFTDDEMVTDKVS